MAQQNVMYSILHQYLIQQKSLSLPGLGTLVLQNIPAISNFSAHLIEPPMQKIIFDELHDAPDKDLFLFIAARLQVEEWEAIKMVNDFSYELKNQLKQTGKVIWENIGVLSSEPGGTITLEAKTITYDFMEPAPAWRIIRKDASHTILRGDTEINENIVRLQGDSTHTISIEDSEPSGKRRWWVAAAIVGAITLTVLLFHFFRNDFNLSSIFNTQKSHAEEAPPTYIQVN